MSSFAYATFSEEETVKIANLAVDVFVDKLVDDGIIGDDVRVKAEPYSIIFVKPNIFRRKWNEFFGLEKDKCAVVAVKR